MFFYAFVDRSFFCLHFCLSYAYALVLRESHSTQSVIQFPRQTNRRRIRPAIASWGIAKESEPVTHAASAAQTRSLLVVCCPRCFSRAICCCPRCCFPRFGARGSSADHRHSTDGRFAFEFSGAIQSGAFLSSRWRGCRSRGVAASG